MDKYGVDTQDQESTTKTGSSDKSRCPRCGSLLTQSNPPLCPIHGSNLKGAG